MALAGFIESNTEALVTVTDSAYVGDGTRRLVVWCHESGGSYLSVWANPTTNALPLADAICSRLGLPIVVPDCGGPLTWGNDTAQQRITDAVAWLGSGVRKAKTDRVILVGFSMGGIAALNWARANPSKVAAVVLLYGEVNLQWAHDNGAAANTEAAYGGSLGTFNAAVAAHNPQQNQSAYVGLPIRIWGATPDTFSSDVEQLAFAAAVGAKRVDLGNVSHGDLSQVSAGQVRQFLAPYA